MVLFLVTTVVKVLIFVSALLVSVAYFTLAERKYMAGAQRRKGPNTVGYEGILQPLADGLKLFTKETVLPSNSDLIIFVSAPAITFILSLVGWAAIPLGEGIVLSDIQIGILYLFSVSSLGVYGIITSGWSSNSKYAFLGSLLSTAQMISYEVSVGFVIVCVAACAGSFNLTEIVLAQKKMFFFVPLFPMFVVFLISVLAETNRHPFDLPEAEAELVSGYNVEYSAMGFALFFLGEYANMLLMGSFTIILFLGGWFPTVNLAFLDFISPPAWFGWKISYFVHFFIISRAVLPRYRYDQLMMLGWKVFLPFSVGYALLISSVLISFNWVSA